MRSCTTQWPRDCLRISGRPFRLDLAYFQFFDFPRQLIYFALQFRQAMEDCDGFKPLFVFKRWNAGVNGFGRDVARDAAFGGDGGAIADLLMAGVSDLCREHASFDRTRRAS